MAGTKKSTTTSKKSASTKNAPTNEVEGTKRGRSSRAGLIFPVGRVARLIKTGRYAQRTSNTAPIYLAAVLEYLASEVLELSARAAADNKKQRITPRHITLAVRNDDELDRIFGNVTIANGGVIPYIPKALLPKSKSVVDGDNNVEGEVAE